MLWERPGYRGAFVLFERREDILASIFCPQSIRECCRSRHHELHRSVLPNAFLGRKDSERAGPGNCIVFGRVSLPFAVLHSVKVQVMSH
jgi:hypothetical protein